MTFVKESVTCTRCGASWETIPDMVSPHFCLTCMSDQATRATPLNAWVRQNYKLDTMQTPLTSADAWFTPTPTSDAINPAHYKDGSMEVWQQMVQLYGIDKYLAFCELNAFKYRMRAGKKQGNSAQQDIEKALWYEAKIKELSK